MLITSLKQIIILLNYKGEVREPMAIPAQAGVTMSVHGREAGKRLVLPGEEESDEGVCIQGPS